MIKADSLDELIRIYRNRNNPITGEKYLLRDISDQMIWDMALEAGCRHAIEGEEK